MQEQQKQLLSDPRKLIPLSEAAKATEYSAEYLSLLSRRGRIPAVKISRDWLTTRQAVLWYVTRQKNKHGQQLKKVTQSGGVR